MVCPSGLNLALGLYITLSTSCQPRSEQLSSATYFQCHDVLPKHMEPRQHEMNFVKW